LTDEQTILTVRQAQAGDVKSLARLYERYAQDMVWLAYSICLDKDLAEDIAQETFAQVCLKLVHLKRPERFAGWLSMICRHLAIDTIRRRRIKTVNLAEAHALPASAADTDNGDNEGVDQAIAGLPRMYREIVVLFYFHSMTYEELSQCLGISIHAVKGRLCRARKKLRAVLSS
jgi:RNA polymerase sigma-70 factor (ECF subfamily)